MTAAFVHRRAGLGAQLLVLLCLAVPLCGDDGWQSLPDDLPQHYGVVGLRAWPESDTLRVRQLRLHGPADRAGLRRGDRLLGADGVRLRTAEDLARYVQSHAPGDTVRFHLRRDAGDVLLPCRVTDRRRLFALMAEQADPLPARRPRHDRLIARISPAEDAARRLVDDLQAEGVVDSLRRAFAAERSAYGADQRLADVDRLLDDPFEADGLARDLAAAFHPDLRPADLLAAAGRHLDLPSRPAPPPLAALDVDTLLQVPLRRAAALIDSALADLADDERRDLRAGALPLLRRFDASLYLDEGDSTETEAHRSTLRLAKRVRREFLVAAAVELARLDDAVVLERLRAGLRQRPRPTRVPAGFGTRLLYAAETDQGWIVVADTTDDVHTGAAALVIDLGGDDTWLAGPGGPLHEAGGGSIGVAIDVAGDDRWVGLRAASLGAAVAGVGLLIDREGDDTYSGGALTQGAAFAGVGLLHDHGGNDTYSARHAAQGAGFFGVGLLIDGDGDDVVTIGQGGQGFGGAGGLGLFADGGGDDRCVADYAVPSSYGTPGIYNGWSQGVGVGFRGDAAGGMGLLVAAGAGNDVYRGGDFAQGTGYFFGLGVLVDLGGRDRYEGSRYAQGAAAHQAVGILWDAAGNDHYRTTIAAGQGAAWDAAVGVLLEDGGDDRYEGAGLAQGAGAMNGVGWLTDAAGNDLYEALSGQANGGVLRYWSGRDAQNLGLLIDGGGTDRYSRDDRGDGLEVRDSRVGLFRDLPLSADKGQIR